MKTIWKFEFSLEASGSVEMPIGARILHVNRLWPQTVTLWAEVDTDHALETRSFAVVGTGHPLPSGSREYLGTFKDQPFVWHVYELNDYAEWQRKYE